MELFPKNKIIIGMVGLPGRGKTYIAKKIARYINWIGFKSQVFNLCQYRRRLAPEANFNSEFFDHENTEGAQILNQCSENALQDLIQFLRDGGDVAIFDGTNESVDKRNAVKKSLDEAFTTYNLIWVESICNDKVNIDKNIQAMAASSPDYKNMDSDVVVHDFIARIEHYRKSYQELSKESDGNETSFIKLHDFGSQVLINNVSGYLESKIISLLMHIHNHPCPIYFSRHGESLFNVADKVGGDPDLSERGYAYAKQLNIFCQEEMKQRKINKNTKIFSSTLQRTKITAGAIDIGIKPVPLKLLNELHSGILEEMTYSEIAEKHPSEAAERKRDKLRYRYPAGESYMDVIHRIEPIIFAIEKSREPVIIVAHQAVIRCFYAYFCQNDIEDIPHLSIPLHTVIKLIPDEYYVHEYRYSLERSRQPAYEKICI